MGEKAANSARSLRWDLIRTLVSVQRHCYNSPAGCFRRKIIFIPSSTSYASMDLTVIMGPMKSGKSYDLISFFAPLKYTAIPYALYQSARHLRDEQIHSRNGSLLAAQRIVSLTEALGNGCKIVGIDEIHMFPAHETLVIDKLLRTGVKVIVSGLDLDYQGKMFDVMRNLLELGPREVRYKRAVCESCKSPDAMYTQVLKDNQALLEGMPSVIPDDGTYSYKATCRYCFVKPL